MDETNFGDLSWSKKIKDKKVVHIRNSNKVKRDFILDRALLEKITFAHTSFTYYNVKIVDSNTLVKVRLL